jgi:hypothetical protein
LTNALRRLQAIALALGASGTEQLSPPFPAFSNLKQYNNNNYDNYYIDILLLRAEGK